VADGDDLDHPLVAEPVGAGQRIPAGEHGDVDIARGDRHRTDDGGVRSAESRLVRLRPADRGRPFEDESLHQGLPVP